MKKNRSHGIISLAIMDLTMVISIYSIAKDSLLLSAAYFIGGLIAIALILYTFCSKCCTKDHCSHVYPGIVAKLFTDKQSIKYKKADYIITGLALAFIMLFPQYWLWQNTQLFIAYWALTIVALAMINKHVCTKCANTKCAMCKRVS